MSGRHRGETCVNGWKSLNLCKEQQQQRLLTHHHILAYAVHVGLVPGGQGVDGHKVGLELAVWVGEHSLQPGDELCGAALVGAQEQPLLVVVVGVDVVPDHRRSPEDLGHLFYGLHGDVFGYNFGTWRSETSSVSYITWFFLATLGLQPIVNNSLLTFGPLWKGPIRETGK